MPSSVERLQALLGQEDGERRPGSHHARLQKGDTVLASIDCGTSLALTALYSVAWRSGARGAMSMRNWALAGCSSSLRLTLFLRPSSSLVVSVSSGGRRFDDGEDGWSLRGGGCSAQDTKGGPRYRGCQSTSKATSLCG